MISTPKDPIDRIIASTYEFGRIMRRQMLTDPKTGAAMNPLQLHALFLISEQEGMTMKELAKLLHVSSPSATSLVNRLVKVQWVGRMHDDRNRKLVRLWLTPLGKRVLKEKHDQRRAALRGIFSLLTAAEQTQLADLHEKLRHKLSAQSSSR